MENKLTDLVKSIVPELPYLVMAGGLVLTVIGSKNDYYTGRKQFQRELASPRPENNCPLAPTDQTYVKKTLEGTGSYILGVPIPFSGREVRVHELELTCDRVYVKAVASFASGVIAERELYRDGRVNVKIDLKNKYQSREGNK